MRRAPLVVLLVVLLVAGCGGDPVGAPGIRVTPESGEVELGKAFPVTVVRTWEKGRGVAEWDPGGLEVRLAGTRVRERDGRVEETRSYDAWAFEDTGGFRVRRALDSENPGAPELPEPPARVRLWWLLPLLALLLLLRRRPERPPPAAPAPGPEVRALERLARLPGETDALYPEATDALKEYVAARFGLRAREMTTQELTARVAGLERILSHADLVKFARHEPAPGETKRMVGAMVAFVEGTA